MNEDKRLSEIRLCVEHLCKLYLTRIRLNLAEKLSRLLAGLSLALIVFSLGLCTLMIATLALRTALAHVLPDYWSYLAVGTLYVIIITLLIALKKRLIANPISRFISKIIVEAPLNTTTDNETD